MIFIIPNRHKYKVVMQPFKNDREGNIVQEPKYIDFEDGVYETNDQNVIDFIHKLRAFGVYIKEVKEVPNTHGYQGHGVGVHKMDFTGDKVDQQNVQQAAQAKEIEDLKQQMEGLGSEVSAIGSAVSEIAKMLSDKRAKEEQREERIRKEKEAKEEAKRKSEEGVG